MGSYGLFLPKTSPWVVHPWKNEIMGLVFADGKMFYNEFEFFHVWNKSKTITVLHYKILENKKDISLGVFTIAVHNIHVIYMSNNKIQTC